MADQSPYLVPPYSALAEVYDRAGLSQYARQAAPQYIAYAQTIDWAGRRVLDLGCGTGASTWAVAGLGYRVAGIDSDPNMLAQGQAHLSNAEGAEFVHDPPAFHLLDLRDFKSPIGPADLVLAVGGVLNAFQSLRDVERVLAQAHAALERGKLFIFDMRTSRGLAQEAERAPTELLDNGDLTLICRHRFNYEMLSVTHEYIIFERRGDSWQRSDETHVERGYPTQAIAALLSRQGFETVAQLTPAMQPFEPLDDPYGRVVFVARSA